MICQHKLYHFTVANIPFTAPLTRRGKTKFATIKWYNLCRQIIQSQTCYPLNYTKSRFLNTFIWEMTEAAFSGNVSITDMNSYRAALRYSLGIQLTSYDLFMQMNQKFFINEKVDGIDFHRYKYIERDSTCTCSLCVLKYVIFRGN